MKVIYGLNPVMEALKRGAGDIKSVIVAEGRDEGSVWKLQSLASQRGIPVFHQRREELDRLVGNTHHQGVVGMSREFRYATVEQIIAQRPKDAAGDLVILLDGITDPQNLGALIRTGHCFGVNGFIIPENRSASLTAAVLKSSAGAMLYTPVAMVVNLARTVDLLKEQGFWIYGADVSGTGDFQVFNQVNRVVLIMGSEGKGIRPLIRKKCDFLVSIPMKGKIDSLNVSVAAGIIIHTIVSGWSRNELS